MAISSDGHTALVGGENANPRLWDVTDTAHPQQLAALPGDHQSVTDAAFSPDGHTVVTVGDSTPRLWEVSDPRQPHLSSVLAGHTDTVWSVAFSPDGHTLATDDADFTARLHDLRQLPLVGHDNKISSVAFSPNGRTLATAGDDTTAHLWDITNPRQPRPAATFAGHTGDVPTVAFSPNGRILATGGDHTARLWETDIHEVSTRVCDLAYPRITSTEWGQHFPGLAYQPPCPA